MSNVMIIAEAGVNHNGDLKIAKQLVDAASVIGADAIKFQTFQAKHLAVPDARKADYQIENTGRTMSQYEMLKSLELSWQEFEELYQYCSFRRIRFLSSPFDVESLLFLDRLGVDLIKIPSGEITNYNYLKNIASLKKPVILSTGMSTEDEVGEALEILEEGGKEIILLHCSSSYPTLMEDVNLNAMNALKHKFHKRVGYSDHTPGIEVAIAAAALGACVIEKHMTLDKTMPGPDHKASLEPDEFQQMVDSIRNIEAALGDGVKKPTQAEQKNRDYVRKYLVASREIKKGEAFTPQNLCAKRSAYGISPMKIPSLLGTVAQRDYRKDERIDQ